MSSRCLALALAFVALDSAPALSRPPRRATFVPLAQLAGSYGFYPPWSPTAPLLAYHDSDGLAVFDAGNPSSKPVEVFQGRFRGVAWSPDGRWLLFATASETWPTKRLDALHAVPASGGAVTTLIDGALIGHFVWSTEGNIYYWADGAEEWRKLAPPAAWRTSYGSPIPGRPALYFCYVQSMHEERAWYVHGGSPVEARPPAETLTPTSYSSCRDGFRDGRVLVRFFGRGAGPAGGSLILDPLGAILMRFAESSDMAPFGATSVAWDESFVAGDRTTDDGHFTLTAKIVLVGVADDWRLTLDAVDWGSDPRLSRVGSFIAYTGKDSLCVGALALED